MIYGKLLPQWKFPRSFIESLLRLAKQCFFLHADDWNHGNCGSKRNTERKYWKGIIWDSSGGQVIVSPSVLLDRLQSLAPLPIVRTHMPSSRCSSAPPPSQPAQGAAFLALMVSRSACHPCLLIGAFPLYTYISSLPLFASWEQYSSSCSSQPWTWLTKWQTGSLWLNQWHFDEGERAKPGKHMQSRFSWFSHLTFDCVIKGKWLIWWGNTIP